MISDNDVIRCRLLMIHRYIWINSYCHGASGLIVWGNLRPHPAARFHEKYKTRYIWTDKACLDAYEPRLRQRILTPEVAGCFAASCLLWTSCCPCFLGALFAFFDAKSAWSKHPHGRGHGLSNCLWSNAADGGKRVHLPSSSDDEETAWRLHGDWRFRRWCRFLADGWLMYDGSPIYSLDSYVKSDSISSPSLMHYLAQMAKMPAELSP